MESDEDRNEIRLQQMLDASREAVLFANGMSSKQLENDRLRILAITRCVEIIGEAATGVSSDFRLLHPEIPWRVIIAMRNRLIHAYFDVDLDILFNTITTDLPQLIDLLEKIVPKSLGGHGRNA